MNYIEDIQKSCSIKEGTGVIERFFQELYFNAPLSSKELSQRIMLPIPMVTMWWWNKANSCRKKL